MDNMRSEKYINPKVMYGTWRSRPPTLSKKDDLSVLISDNKDQENVDLAKITPNNDDTAQNYFDKSENDNYFHQEYSTSKCNPHYNSDNEDDVHSNFDDCFESMFKNDDAQKKCNCVKSLEESVSKVKNVDHSKTSLLDNSTVKFGNVKNLKLLFETNDRNKPCNYIIPKHNTVGLSNPRKSSIPKAIIKPFITKPDRESHQRALTPQGNLDTKLKSSTEVITHNKDSFDNKSSSNLSNKPSEISTSNSYDKPSTYQLEPKEESKNSKIEMEHLLSIQNNTQNNVLRSSKIFKRRKKLVSRAAEIASSFRRQEGKNIKFKQNESNVPRIVDPLKEDIGGVIQTIKIEKNEISEQNTEGSENKNGELTDFEEMNFIQKNIEVYVDLNLSSIQVNSLIRSKRILENGADTHTSNDKKKACEITLIKKTIIDMNYSEERRDILKKFIDIYEDKIDNKCSQVDKEQKQWLLGKLEFIL